MEQANGAEQRRGISRRGVVAGAAWAVPAVLVGTAVPAFAASGPPPSLAYQGACKLPGGSCHIAELKFGYKFNFLATNPSNKTIYICAVTFSATGTAVDPLTWSGTGDPANPCLVIPPGATTSINIYAQTAASANTTFTTTMTVQWAHTCPCTNDPDLSMHTPVSTTFTVTGTPPACATCTGPN